MGLVLVACTGVSLVVARGSAAQEDGGYPVRFALPPPGFPEPAGEERAQISNERDDTTALANAPGGEERDAPGLPDGFASAFADAAVVPEVPAQVADPPPAAKGGLAAVQFNLADPYAPASKDGTAGPIELTKGVRVNGAEAGNATIRVTDGATIAIARDALDKLLAGAGRGDLAQTLANGGPFVSFDRIRQAGLNVSYDAASDRILLSS